MQKLNSILGEIWGRAHIDAYQNEVEIAKGTGVELSSKALHDIYVYSVPIRYENIDRDDLDPITKGFFRAALRKWPDHTVDDVYYETIQQVTTDCVRFYFSEMFWFQQQWFDPFSVLTPKNTGRAIYYSRNYQSKKGFRSFITDPFSFDLIHENYMWDSLHLNATTYLGRFVMRENTKTGQLRGYNVP